MLLFKDFTKSFFSFKEVSALLPTINKWIDDNNIEVLNMETLYVFGGTLSRSETGFRVWYMV